MPDIQSPLVERRNSATRRFGHPLKIALLGYRSDPFVGGQGIYLNYLSDGLTKMGHRVDVISGPPYPQLSDQVNLIKVPSLDLYAATNSTTALRLEHLRSYTDTIEWWQKLTGGFAEPYTFGRRVAKLLRNNDYDIVHDNQSLAFGLLDIQKQGTPVISTIHHPIHRDRELALAAAPNWQYRILIRRWYSFLKMQEKVSKKLHHIMTVSEASKKDIAHYFRRSDNVKLIPNGIDTDMFKPMGVSKTPFRIITTASSDQALKGLSVLLNALAETVKRYPHTHLRIIGKLKQGGTAEQLIETYGLQNHVSFLSAISTETLALEYNKASIAVCPSLYEGFGLPVGEAMACGLAVVTTNGGALPEVVGDAGIIVEAGDAMALAAGIQLLFDNRELATALAQNARQRIVEKFCWKQVAAQMTRYYHDVIAGKNC